VSTLSSGFRARHPAQLIALFFSSGIAIGTGLLMLPIARQGPGQATFTEAFFTATSALCVTGLSTVDVPQHWSLFGELTILTMIQIGGFGIMTLASLLGLIVARRLGLKSRLNASVEANASGIGEVRTLVFGIFRITALTELVIALMLTVRFALGHDETWLKSAYLGLFHSVSAFNNAGFALFSDSLVSFATDIWIVMPINVAVILGGLGFPVLLELRRRLAPPLWSLHTKITLVGTLVLLLAGWVVLAALEWANPATIGDHSTVDKLLLSFSNSVQPRTAGFNVVDYSQMSEAGLYATSILMFIGGGSASTAGGIKVATFFLLLFVILAEVRGTRDVNVADRRVAERAQRQGLAVALLATGLIVCSTLVLMVLEPLTLSLAMFEVTSAFGTVGLSAGVTSTLGTPAQILLIFLMFIGRLGPITLVSALALRQRDLLYRNPEGRPLIG
jgi:trk system potassium uptake protein